MRAQRLRGVALVAALLVALSLGAKLVRGPWSDAGGGRSEERAGDPIAAADGHRALTARLSQLGWDDVAATVAGVGATHERRADVLEATADATRPEVLYVRALLLLAESRPEEALATFGSIPVDAMPATHLYAPYRLHESLRPGQPNPYRAPLVAARRAGSLSPLVAARIAAAEGDLRAALHGYVASDPAQWARHDVLVFRALRLHAGLSPDTATMLAAAIRGGRVPERLRPDLLRLLATDGDRSLPELRAGLKRLLAENPEARRVAMAAAEAQLRARQLFLGRRYATLVAEHRASEPTSLPDGTLVLLVVSASRAGEAALVDLWAQELRRRHPEPEVASWLAGLRVDRS